MSLTKTYLPELAAKYKICIPCQIRPLPFEVVLKYLSESGIRDLCMKHKKEHLAERI